MAITVNSNVASLNAQRNLMNSTTALGKSLERLSSGLRINRAGDDAAGLAISESLRSQVRGLNQAIRNANDGISVVGTAEGALEEVTSILQRIRELAVQSSNDTNSASNRASLQAEVQQNLDELTRIANTVQFNGLSLLDGSFSNKQIQAGAQKGQTISISIDDVRSSNLGAIAEETSTAMTAALASGDLVLNGVSIGASADDELSVDGGDYSAIAIAAAINAHEAETGVTATANATEKVASSSTVGAVTLDGDASAGESLTINGVNIGAVTVAANDSDGNLVKAINNVSTQTGVVASVDSGTLTLTAADGRNITVTTTGSIADELGFAGADGDVTDDTTAGTITLVSGSAFSIAGASVADAGLSAKVVTVDKTTSIASADVTTAENAGNAIRTVDFALKQVSETRSNLGALTNRLESTIRNLSTVSENLAASDSRIRDADFATETASLVRNQILQQAGMSILAQANVMPQAALSLLG